MIQISEKLLDIVPDDFPQSLKADVQVIFGK
jgi:hypothetical protein